MKHWLVITLLTAGAIGRSAQAQEITVMTRNLYLGASLDAALATNTPLEIPGVVSQTWAQILAANFPERAQALADEIGETRPHLIGLQEVQIRVMGADERSSLPYPRFRPIGGWAGGSPCTSHGSHVVRRVRSDC